MKLKITFFLLLSALNINAQETRFVFKKLNGKVFEEYYVIKENKKIKHGQYVKYTLSSFDEGKNLWLLNEGIIMLLESGNYNYGRKQGIWTDYAYNNKISEIYNYDVDTLNGEFYSYWSDSVKSKSKPVYSNQKKSKNDIFTIDVQKDSLPVHIYGFYCKGKECSVWSYYNTMNVLYFQYNYDNKILVNDSYNNLYNVKVDTVKEIKHPIFILGGNSELRDGLKQLLQYFPFEKNIKVSIKLNVDRTGTVLSCELLNLPISKRKIKKLNRDLNSYKGAFIPKKENYKFIDGFVLLEYNVILEKGLTNILNIDPIKY